MTRLRAGDLGHARSAFWRRPRRWRNALLPGIMRFAGSNFVNAMVAPSTRYVSVGASDVAYQVIGDGPIDILYSYGLGAHLDVAWDSPLSSVFLNRLAGFSRLIVFDRRGTGASDGIPRGAMPTWEEWTDDMLAVLDAAGSERAAVFAPLDAGPIAILFASLHPERVSALILLTTAARYLAADDYPGAVDRHGRRHRQDDRAGVGYSRVRTADAPEDER